MAPVTGPMTKTLHGFTTSASARTRAVDGRRITPSTRRRAARRHTVSDTARAPEVAEVVRAAVLDVRDEGRAERFRVRSATTAGLRGAVSARRPRAVKAVVARRRLTSLNVGVDARRAQTLIASFSSDTVYLWRDARRGAVLTPALTRQCGCNTERHFIWFRCIPFYATF